MTAVTEQLAGARALHLQGMLEIARTADADPAVPRPVRAVDLLLDGFTTRLTRGYPAAAPLLRSAVHLVLAEPVEADPTRRQLAMGCWATCELLDDEAGHTLASRWVRADRERRALSTLPLALAFLARSETVAGRFAAAEAHLAEARQVARATGLIGVACFPRSADLLLLAWRGRETEVRWATADRHRWIGEGLGAGVTGERHALAIIELGSGRYDAVLGDLMTVYRADPPGMGTAVLPDLVEAAARTGDHATANAALDRLSVR
jgi:hypothetical protein